MWPSAGDLATAAAAMVPPPPARFSPSTGLPRRSCSFGAMARNTTSMPPPGGKGTTKVIGRFGKSSAAIGAPVAASVHAARAATIHRRDIIAVLRQRRRVRALACGYTLAGRALPSRLRVPSLSLFLLLAVTHGTQDIARTGPATSSAEAPTAGRRMGYPPAHLRAAGALSARRRPQARRRGLHARRSPVAASGAGLLSRLAGAVVPARPFLRIHVARPGPRAEAAARGDGARARRHRYRDRYAEARRRDRHAFRLPHGAAVRSPHGGARPRGRSAGALHGARRGRSGGLGR